jgi:hypothetical protein
MRDPAAYRLAAESLGNLPAFMSPWWLDATCGPGGWSAAIVGDPASPSGVLPYRMTRKFGLRLLGQPPLTQFLGPWLSPRIQALGNGVSEAKEVMDELIDALPPHDHYAQNWSPAMQDWLPFYWRGFAQTTRYTYRIPADRAEDDCWALCKANIKSDVKKAAGRHGLEVTEQGALAEFMRLNELTFDRQGKRTPYSAGFVERIDAACAERGRRTIIIAKDPAGRSHAGAYIVHDGLTAYYLMGGADSDLRGSGASSLCLWHAIKLSRRLGVAFDFEGSMLKPVERFFRAFGGEATPFFHVSRARSKLALAMLAIRKLRAQRQ